MASSSSNVVGVHYRVGKKIGEGSFGVIFEGTNLLNNQSVAIKFVRMHRKQTMRGMADLCLLLKNGEFLDRAGADAVCFLGTSQK